VEPGRGDSLSDPGKSILRAKRTPLRAPQNWKPSLAARVCWWKRKVRKFKVLTI